MKTLVLMILAVFVSLPLASGQSEQEYARARYFYGDEAKQLVKTLAALPQIPIGFENADRSPLAIVEAGVSSVRWHQPGESTLTTTAENEYAVSERITVVNKTDRHIRSAVLVFTDIYLRKRFDVSASIFLEPYGSTIFGEPRNGASVLISLPMKPGNLSVKVLEVVFADGTIWGEDSRDVDEAPVPLTMPPQPPHTEEALRNRIQGPLRMRLLVGKDGEVKRVKVIRGLPDGLDEQAVQQAYGLNFKPAMRAGQPVECWLLFELEYNLQLFRRSSTNADKPRQ